MNVASPGRLSATIIPIRAGRPGAPRLRVERAAAAEDERDPALRASRRAASCVTGSLGRVPLPQSWRSTGMPSVPVIVPGSIEHLVVVPQRRRGLAGCSAGTASA